MNILAQRTSQSQGKRPGRWVSANIHLLLHLLRVDLTAVSSRKRFSFLFLFQRDQTLKKSQSPRTASAVRANGRLTPQCFNQTQKPSIHTASNTMTPTFAQILRKMFQQIVILRFPSANSSILVCWTHSCKNESLETNRITKVFFLRVVKTQGT